MAGTRSITRIQDADDYAALQDPAAATKGLRSLGTAATQAAAGNDSRLTDARTPTAHHTTHETGGSDAVAALDGSVITAGTVAAARLGTGTPGLSTRLVNGAWVPHVVRRSTDSSAKTNNTLAADDTLLWAVAANEVWFFQAYLIVNGANATMDSKFGWTVPAGTTMFWGGNGTAGSTAPGYGSASVATAVTALLGAAGTISVATSTAPVGVGLAGTVIVSSTAGNVNLTWAQDTTNASSLVLSANSILLLWRLA